MQHIGRKIRVALAGAGAIAGVHMRNLQQMPEVQIVAVCGAGTERATRLAAACGALACNDLDRMLNQAEVDALVVCLPPFAHGDIIQRAAARGLHLYIEKPVALDLETALRNVEAIEQADVIAGVGYMWRYAPVVEQLKRLLDPAQPAMLLGRMLNGPNANQWSLDRSLSGGLLVEFSTHVFDLLRYIGGEVTSVCGAGAEVNSGPPSRGIDSAVVALTFANGAVGSLETSWAYLGSAWDLQVLAPQTRLQLSLVPERLHGSVGGEQLDVASPPLPEIMPHGFSGGPSWYLSVRAFIEAVQQGSARPIRCSYRDGVRTLALTLAADEAIRTGRPSNVPFM